MTDKQIIIDGIDVSGCLFYQTNFEEDYDVKIKHYCSNWHNSCESNNNSNCYYKQLLRKEQEYEELRQYHNKCCEENAKKEAEWLEKYNQVSRDFYNGKYCNKENCSLLQAKEQECENVRSELIEANKQVIYLAKQLDQLEAENEELKRKFERTKEASNCNLKALGEMTEWANNLNEENDKLKQTLIEIKEIVEVEIECKTYEIENDCFNETRCKALNEHIDFAEQILQKISEVENEYIN